MRMYFISLYILKMNRRYIFSSSWCISHPFIDLSMLSLIWILWIRFLEFIHNNCFCRQIQTYHIVGFGVRVVSFEQGLPEAQWIWKFDTRRTPVFRQVNWNINSSPESSSSILRVRILQLLVHVSRRRLKNMIIYGEICSHRSRGYLHIQNHVDLYAAWLSWTPRKSGRKGYLKNVDPF